MALGSPLSSVPSSPASDRDIARSMLRIGASPTTIRGRSRFTRAQTRALAAVLRPTPAERGLSAPTKRRRDPDLGCEERRPKKKTRVVREDEVKEEAGGLQEDLGRRTFPPSVSIHPAFTLFYRKFAVPKDRFTYVRVLFLAPRLWLISSLAPSPSALPGATPNLPRSALDLYIPRWVKGRGTTKVRFCTT